MSQSPTGTMTPTTPQRVMHFSLGFIASRVLAAGVELDLFTHVAEGARTVEDLAARAGASPRGVRILTDALAGMGFLEKEGAELRLAPDARTFLVKSSPGYLGAVVLHQNDVWETWRHLGQAVRTGTTPSPAVEGDFDAGEFFSHFVDGLYNLNFPAAQAAAARLADGVRDVLDVGAGSGVWSQAFARANPEARVTVVDYPAVLDRVTRPFAERAGAQDRHEFLQGNFRDVDFGEGRYDLAILGHILHSEGAERSLTLLRRLHRALRPGGRVLVAEMIPDEDRKSDLFALLFGVNMLALTQEGDVFTRTELERLGRDAGFPHAEWLQAPAPYPLLVLTRT